MWYNNVLLIHRSSRSPFSAGEGLRGSADFFDIQRTSFIAIILFRQKGKFLSNYFALVIEFLRTFSIKYSTLICKIILLNNLR